MSFPRLIKPEEVKVERDTVRISEPGHSGVLVSSLILSCHCANCRDYFDPMGEDTAAYLNCQPSMFDKGVSLPSFLGSMLYQHSFYKTRKPGLYVRHLNSAPLIFCTNIPTLKHLMTQEPLPEHLLRLVDGSVEDHFYLQKETGLYSRFTYVKSQMVVYRGYVLKEFTPADVLAKLTPMMPEEDYEWEHQELHSLTSKTCEGCELGHLNQLGHQGTGGCLEQMFKRNCADCGHLIDEVTELDLYGSAILLCMECETKCSEKN